MLASAIQAPKSMENISDLRLLNHSEVLCYGPRSSSSNDFNRAYIFISVKKNIVPLLSHYSIWHPSRLHKVKSP